jgi:hypothetical protein
MDQNVANDVAKEIWCISQVEEFIKSAMQNFWVSLDRINQA